VLQRDHLEFELDSELDVENSLYTVDVLAVALADLWFAAAVLKWHASSRGRLGLRVARSTSASARREENVKRTWGKRVGGVILAL
jgi:hypothetical protein